MAERTGIASCLAGLKSALLQRNLYFFFGVTPLN